MRSIGSFPDEATARRVGDVLLAKGIETQVDPAADGTWEIWVLDDDRLEDAETLLTAFRADPDREEYRRLADEAVGLRRKAEKEEKRAAKLYRGREALLNPSPWRATPVTWTLIALSVAAALLTRLGQYLEPGHFLLISEPVSMGDAVFWRRGFPEILSGQVWRLVTPMFLHFGVMHLVFNLLWLRDLGGMVERHFGWRYLAGFVLIVSALANVGQYVQSGPMFGGMSGVVYGLLGFVWIRGKLDPFSGVFLHPTTVTMMIVWYVLCLVGFIPYVANTVHTVGLLAGVGWGYLSARRALSRY